MPPISKRKEARPGRQANGAVAKTQLKASSDKSAFSGQFDTQTGGQFWISVSAIFLLGIILRFVALSLKPLHNDEGVNGFFLQNLFLHNQYAYDPNNYHGPSIYYIALPFIYLFGTSVTTLRAVTGVFSLLTIWMVVGLRSKIGARGAVYAALLLCVSPGSVFFARYFIHETLVACFTLGIAIFGWDFSRTRKQSDLLWCSVWAGLLFATKETAPIHCAILAVSAVFTAVWMKNAQEVQSEQVELTSPGQPSNLLSWAMAVAIFLSINFVLYSSMFTHYQGVRDALHAFSNWFGKSGSQQVHPWWQHFVWIAQGDFVLLVFGSLGVIYALVTRTNRFAVFTAFWLMGTFLAYSISAYKTPWLVLNMLTPLSILAGNLIAAVPVKSYRAIIGVAACASCLFLNYSFNLVRYDDDSSPYVYSQTQRGFFGLYNVIRRYSNGRNDGGQTAIAVVSPDYWPLPWYLRRDNYVSYFGKIETVPAETRLIIASQVQEAKMNQLVGNGFVLQGRYPLRPGMVLDLYVRTFE